MGKAIANKGKTFEAWKTGKALGHHKMQPNALPDRHCLFSPLSG